MHNAHQKQQNESRTSGTVKSTLERSSSQLLDLNDSPRVLMNPENAVLSTSVEVRTVVRKVSESRMPRLPSIATEFTEMLLQVLKVEDQRAASQPVRVLRDPIFDSDVFKRSIKCTKAL